jgi:VWFA-related protein
VTLDVSVLDRERMPVGGLRAADFTLLEDGKPQKVETFSAVELPDVITPATEAPARWVREVGADVVGNAQFNDRRLVVIVMDDATPTPATDVLRAKTCARKVIEQLGLNDLAAVAYTLNKGEGQEFTEDRARLLAAVDRFNASIDNTYGLDRRHNWRRLAFDEFNASAAALYHGVFLTLTGLAEDLGKLPGRRKAIIFISVGIPLDAGDSWTNEIDPTLERAAEVQRAIADLPDSFRAAGRANVNIYAIDPGGLRAPNDMTLASATPADPGRANREFLQTLSENTGGFAIINTNDPGPGITQAFRENGSYYLLGYAPTNLRQAGRYRRIEVRVNRPGVTVRTRNGYFEPAASAAGAKAVAHPAAVEEALAGIVPKADLQMQVSAMPFAMPGSEQAEIAVVLGVRQGTPNRATRLANRIDLRVAAYTPDGRTRATRRETVEVTLNKPGFGTMVGYEVMSRLRLAPGRYQLRLAAETSVHGIQVTPGAPRVMMVDPDADISNKSGSVYCDLDVPDFANAPLSLSGVVFSVLPAVTSGPKNALASILPVVPTTLRQFTNTDLVTALVRTYQGGKGAVVPVTLDVRIVDGKDAKVFETTEPLTADRFAKGRAAEYSLAVPIAQLKTGPHLLTIEAKAGDKSVKRDVRFDVW